jgi:hypothetical protein
MNRNPLFLGGISLGAGLMYVFDPDRGRRRRATARDAAHRIANAFDDAVGKTSRDLSDRAQGLVAELNSIFRCEEADDAMVAARVRSKLGRVISHPHGIHVAVNQGHVILSGQILASEVDHLINRVWSVRGVTGVENRLEAHERAGGVSSLQGGTTRHGETPELMRSNWSPGIRFLAGIGGGALTLYGARRKDIISAAEDLVDDAEYRVKQDPRRRRRSDGRSIRWAPASVRRQKSCRGRCRDRSKMDRFRLMDAAAPFAMNRRCKFLPRADARFSARFIGLRASSAIRPSPSYL